MPCRGGRRIPVNPNASMLVQGRRSLLAIRRVQAQCCQADRASRLVPRVRRVLDTARGHHDTHCSRYPTLALVRARRRAFHKRELVQLEVHAALEHLAENPTARELGRTLQFGARRHRVRQRVFPTRETIRCATRATLCLARLREGRTGMRFQRLAGRQPRARFPQFARTRLLARQRQRDEDRCRVVYPNARARCHML